MRRVAIPALLMILAAASVIGLTRAWYAVPASLPEPLRWLGNRIIQWLGIEGAEATADAELVYLIGIAVLLTAVVLTVALWALRRLRAKRS